MARRSVRSLNRMTPFGVGTSRAGCTSAIHHVDDVDSGYPIVGLCIRKSNSIRKYRRKRRFERRSTGPSTTGIAAPRRSVKTSKGLMVSQRRSQRKSSTLTFVNGPKPTTAHASTSSTVTSRMGSTTISVAMTIARRLIGACLGCFATILIEYVSPPRTSCFGFQCSITPKPLST